MERKGKGKGKAGEAEVDTGEPPKNKEVLSPAGEEDPNQELDVSRTPDQRAADVALRERERSWADASEAPEN